MVAPPTEPRLAGAWAALTFTVATLLLAYPALGGAFLVNPRSDQYIAGYSFREFSSSWMKAGDGFPLWNSYQFGGMPFVAGMHGDIFYPTFLLRLVMPTDVAMTWGLIIHVFLAGLFCYYFLRAMGVGFFGAVIGGLAYMMGGNVAGLVSPGHDGKLFISALLPLTLLFVHRGVRDGRPWAWGALALTITLAVLTPHPQLLQYLLLVAGAYALFLAFTAPAETAPFLRRASARRLAYAAGAVALGMLGGAIQYLPVVEYTPWSPRAGGKGWEHAVSYSMPPEELINTYLPQFSGILTNYFGRNGIHLHSEYLGAAVLLLAGLAFGVPKARRRIVWFWTGALIIAALWALGGFTPFYHIVYAIVPGTKFFRAPSTMLYVVSFCVAVLAAIGVDRALTMRMRPRYLAGWMAGAAIVVVLAVSGALTALATTFALERAREPGERELIASFVGSNRGAIIAGALRSLAVVAACAGALFAMVRGMLTPRLVGWALVVLVAVDLWSVERLYWQFSARGTELFASDPVIDFLKSVPEPGRVAPVITRQLESTVRDPYYGDGFGRAGGLMVHRIRSATGYHGNELGRYDALTGWDRDWPTNLGSPNVRRLLNIRYLYTNASEPPIPGARLVAGPVANVVGNVTSVYELAEPNPAAWVTSIGVAAPDAEVLPALLDARFDVGRVALIDPASELPTQPVPTTLPPPTGITVRVSRWAPGDIALTLSGPAPANAVLMVSENYYPGWSAVVDGKPAPVGRADYVLIGVGLPAGATTVALSFRSRAYELGKMITVVCVLLSFAMLIAGTVVDHRNRQAMT
jgi:hypothetical protein